MRSLGAKFNSGMLNMSVRSVDTNGEDLTMQLMARCRKNRVWGKLCGRSQLEEGTMSDLNPSVAFPHT